MTDEEKAEYERPVRALYSAARGNCAADCDWHRPLRSVAADGRDEAMARRARAMMTRT